MTFRSSDMRRLAVALALVSMGCESGPAAVELWVSDVGGQSVRVFDAQGVDRGRLDRADLPEGVAVDGFAPSAVALDDRHAQVANFATGEVLTFDRATMQFERVFRPESVVARLEEPCAMRWIDGHLYVLGNDSRNLLVLDGQGQVVRELGDGDPIRSPHGFDLGPDGLVYVASSATTQDAGLIQVWDPQTGERVHGFAPYTELGEGTGVTLGPEGLLWVVDWFGDQVVRYDPVDGERFDVVAGPGDVSGPVSVAFDAEGTPYVLDRLGVLRLDPRGAHRLVDAVAEGIAWGRNITVALP